MIILISGSNHIRNRYIISQTSNHIYTKQKMLSGTYNTRPQVVVVGFMDYSISKVYCHYCLTSIDFFFFRFRIDAITLFAIPAAGPHGFHALGRYVRIFSTLESCVNYNHPPRTIESTLRTMNNLLERLHASFFFYIMTGPQTFLKIGYFLPSAILISVAMMFHGLSTWVNAAWTHDTNLGPTEKKNSLSSSPPPSIKWKNRKRPVIAVLGIMISTHILGLLLFWTITRSWFMGKYQVGLLIIISFMNLT